MDATLKTGLQAPAFRIFAGVRIDLWNVATLRLLNGLGVVDVAGGTFAGEDAAYGRLEALDQVSDGAGDQAPALKLTLLAHDAAAVDALIDPRAQGSAVTITLGVVGPDGLCVGTPEPIFIGEIDVPTFIPTRTQLAVELNCASVFERFFDRDDGARLSNSFWTSIYPGDTGLEDEVSLIKPVFWGEATVDPADPTGTGLVSQVVLAAMRAANRA